MAKREENDMKTNNFKIVFFGVFLVLTLFLLIHGIFAETSGNSGNANLTIWDDTDSEGIIKKTICEEYCDKRGKTFNHYNVIFYSNYTNNTGDAINASLGNCNISFDDTTGWNAPSEMSYNSIDSLWVYNRSFNYKGELNFSVNCTGNDGDIKLYDNITIGNTKPYILKDTLEGYVDINADELWDSINDTFICYEDTACVYDFSANVSEDDYNDVLIYSNSSANTTLDDWTYLLNESTGVLTINITNDDDADPQDRSMGLDVTDSTITDTALLQIMLIPVNDAPYFTNLEDIHTWNEMDENITFLLNAYDEEGEYSGEGYPLNFSYNITSCDYGDGSSRTDDVGCDDFFLDNAIEGNNSFNLTMNATNDFVGSYNITFNVSDGNTNVLVNTTFIIENVNNAPDFTFVCDDTRLSVEDEVVTCWINATDIDEVNNLTFVTEYSWFTFNNSQDTITIPMGGDNDVSALINFTTSDIIVGNWSINVSVSDTDEENPKNDTTTFWFYIDNINDPVNLTEVDNFTAYEGSTYAVSVNASDDDLLIPLGDDDLKVYNETLVFSLTNSSGGDVTWINIIDEDDTTDGVQEIFLNFTATSDLEGDHILNLTVTDGSGNKDTKIFNITVSLNNIPQWNMSEIYNFTLWEDVLFDINISDYVNDLDNDSINFTVVEGAPPSFNLTLGGIINFTSLDADVGFWQIEIEATDGKTPNSTIFNFTINNINDAPIIEGVLVIVPAGEDISDGLVNVSEKTPLNFNLSIRDDDLLIPEGMKDEFYREILNVTTIIANLTPVQTAVDFVFSFYSDSGNMSYYTLGDDFFPTYFNVGLYNITINVTDASNESTLISFNLSVDGVNDEPVLMNLSNQYTAIDNRTFYYRINATDEEDNDTTEEGHNLTFNYSYIEYNGVDILSVENFNITTGIINFTVNSTYEGKYHINLSVNDSDGARDFGDFWIYVYGFPNITLPLIDYNFTGDENLTQNLIFNANHSIADNLTYELYLDEIVYLSSNVTNYTYANLSLRDNLIYYGNGTNLSWEFIPTFSDETYGMHKNLTLIVYPSNENLTNASLMNTTMNWRINVTHVNAPFVFTGTIDDQQNLSTAVIIVDLSNYFSDVDAEDKYYSQNVSFSVETNSSPTRIFMNISEWNLSVESKGAITSERINVTGSDLNESGFPLTSVVSNNFKVTFTEPEVTEIIKTVTKTVKEIVSLKLIFFGMINVTREGRVELPITLSNEGTKILKKVNLSYVLFKDGVMVDYPTGEFNVSYFDVLERNEKQHIMFIIKEGITGIGSYKIILNVTVIDPKYSDWGEVNLNLIESNETRDQIVFTSQFIASNPQCIEMKEIIDRAQELYYAGRYAEAIELSKEVFLSCQEAIAQVNLPGLNESVSVSLELYFLIFLSLSLVFGLMYYFYRRSSFTKDILNGGKV